MNIRNAMSFIAASALVALMVAGTGMPQAAGKFFCAPCNQECDNTTHDQAGRCPVCGMALVSEDELKEVANVAILLFEGVQIIDYTGPYEVFGQMDNTRVYTVSETGVTLTTAMGMTVTPKYSFENAPEPDILVVPGGAASNAYDNPKVVAWVAAKAQSAEHVMSVCNGAFILAKAGLLDGAKATTFYGLIDELRTFAPKTTVVTDQRFVDNGKVITSAGLSSGIDASLYLVGKIQGQARARQLALHLEYDWRPESTFARAALADMRLPSFAPPAGVETTLVATSGDRNQWERRFTIKGEMTPEALMTYIVEKVSALPGWSLEPQRVNASAGRVEGTYKDADGTTWRSSTLIEPSKDAGTQIVTMTIEKRGAPSGH